MSVRLHQDGIRGGTGKTEVIFLIAAIGVAALVAVTLFGRKLSDQGKSMSSALDQGAAGTPTGHRPVDLVGPTAGGNAPAGPPATAAPPTAGTQAPGLQRREGGSNADATSPFTEVADFDMVQNKATLAGRAQNAIDRYGAGSMGPADAGTWDDLQSDPELRQDALNWLKKHRDWTTKDSPIRRLYDLLERKRSGAEIVAANNRDVEAIRRREEAAMEKFAREFADLAKDAAELAAFSNYQTGIGHLMMLRRMRDDLRNAGGLDEDRNRRLNNAIAAMEGLLKQAPNRELSLDRMREIEAHMAQALRDIQGGWATQSDENLRWADEYRKAAERTRMVQMFADPAFTALSGACPIAGPILLGLREGIKSWGRGDQPETIVVRALATGLVARIPTRDSAVLDATFRSYAEVLKELASQATKQDFRQDQLEKAFVDRFAATLAMNLAVKAADNEQVQSLARTAARTLYAINLKPALRDPSTTGEKKPGEAY